MRKLLFFIAVISFALYSCKNDGKTHSGVQDSTIVKNDSADGNSINEEAEKIRLDSIREDSIQKIEATTEAIPSFNRLIHTENQSALFKKLGYEISHKKVKNELYDYLDFQDPYITFMTATKDLGNGTEITYQQDYCGSYKMTIKGMPEVLENYFKETKKQVKQYNRKYGDAIYYLIAEKHGDKITVKVPCN